MIKIINPNNLPQEDIESYYHDTNFDFTVIIDKQPKIILDNQSFTLNFNAPTYQRLISQQHPLLSAIGKKPTSILDGFGGLGKDGFILAHQGHAVTTCEINPILYRLLSSALEHYPHKNLQWEIKPGNVLDYLKPYDVIYLDPMFETNTSAKPKLAMQVIQSIVKEQTFTEWEQVKSMANKRLVIKQHQTSKPILPKPSLQIKGKRNVRYDIYLV